MKTKPRIYPTRMSWGALAWNCRDAEGNSGISCNTPETAYMNFMALRALHTSGQMACVGVMEMIGPPSTQSDAATPTSH
jgi:hypothetical protein